MTIALVIAAVVILATVLAIRARRAVPEPTARGLSARPGETATERLADGRTATVSVDKHGRSASFTIE